METYESAETTTSEKRFLMASLAGDSVLVGREAARQIRHSLEVTQNVERRDVGILNFVDIRAVSVPFVEELLVPLLSVRGRRTWQVANANHDVAATIDQTLRMNGVCVVAFPGMQLLGAEASLRETLQVAAEFQDTFRASDIATELRLSVQAANNRLKSLLLAGAITREPTHARHGGREFKYRLPLKDLSTAA